MQLSAIALSRTILVDIELPNLADLATEQESMLADWLAKLMAELRVPTESEMEADDLQRQHFEILVDDLQFRQDRFPQLLRSSNFLIAYGTMESALHGLARATYRDQLCAAAPIARNFYIKSARTYFESANVDFAKFIADWDVLDKYRLVRNVIAHNSGLVDPAGNDYVALMAFVNSRGDIRIDNNRSLMLGDVWCRNFVAVGQNVVRAICDQLLSMLPK